MKKIIILAMVMLFSALGWAQSNIDEYSITVHVTSSELSWVPGGVSVPPVQHLRVVIDGKKCELQSEARGYALLDLGDYRAKLVKDVHKTPYQTEQTYEFQFSDKKTMKFSVFGQSE